MKNKRGKTGLLILGCGLAAAAFLALNCQKTDNNPPAENEIIIENFAFNPAVDTIALGTTVTWINRDSATHRVNSGAPANPDSLFDSGDLAPDDSFSYMFDTAGTFPYFCSIHTAMTGSIIVQ